MNSEQEPGGSATSTRIALVLNAASGSSSDRAGDPQVADLPSTLRELGAEVTMVPVHALAPNGTGVAPVDLQHYDRLVVAGGDGSIGPAAHLAAVAGVPLAVVPTGTANDFARAAALPTEVSDACRLAVCGERFRHLDLALLDGRPFLNVASMGLAEPAARAAHGLKRLLGPLAYGVGAATASFSAPSTNCTVVVDGTTRFEGEAWQVSIANTGAFGGGASIDAALDDDARLDVVVVVGARVGLLRRAWGLRNGTITDQEAVGHFRGRTIEVHHESGASWIVDGETCPADGATSRATLHPDAIRLVVPDRAPTTVP